jgi:hypothetical protein
VTIGTIERVNLILAKVEILKLKTVNSGYDWSCTPDDDKEKVEQVLEEIDRLLGESHDQ